MTKLHSFSQHGPGRNTDPKIMLMRKSNTAATTKHTSGGQPKRKARPKTVSLATKPINAADIK